MKNNKVLDERLLFEKKKIESDVFKILYFGLIIGIILQKALYDAPFYQYAAELVLVMVAGAYYAFKSIYVGNNICNESYNEQTNVIITSFVCGIATTIIATALNLINIGIGEMGGLTNVIISAIITLFVGTTITFIVFEGFYLLNKKRQKEIEAKYNNEDEEI